MTEDERVVVEWALWNVRAGELPRDVRVACHRLVASGRYPRPPVANCPPLDVTVTAFPRDETRPLVDRQTSRAHVAAVVNELAQPDVDYLLVHLERTDP